MAGYDPGVLKQRIRGGEREIKITFKNKEPQFYMDGELLRTGAYINSSGKICFKICPVCRLENYGPFVASACCSWCGFKAEALEEGSFINRVKDMLHNLLIK